MCLCLCLIIELFSVLINLKHLWLHAPNHTELVLTNGELNLSKETLFVLRVNQLREINLTEWLIEQGVTECIRMVDLLPFVP